MNYLLPPEAFASPDWYAQEQRLIFTNRWAPVTDVQRLSGAGSYVTTTVGLAPIVVVRGDDGVLRAFHNICRHRGMLLLDGEGRCGDTINCFYHQWRFARSGELVMVPQRKEQFVDLDISRWGLLPASVDVWEGTVFVHPDPVAPPLAQHVQPLVEHLGSHRPGLLEEVARIDLDVRCNWKLFVENHIDAYHLWYLHDATLSDFDHTKFEHSSTAGNWFSYEPLRDGDPSAPTLGRRTVEIAHLAERDRRGLGAHLLFPSLLVAAAAEFFMTYEAVPVAPDHTRIEVRIRAEVGADGDRLVDAARSFIDEDVVACERIQRAVRSPAFSVGPLARRHEAPIARFHERLLEVLGS
jgi:phenylpropionate dioxygenase-like ring-hydroxylating dioxygenase large terminal subunit